MNICQEKKLGCLFFQGTFLKCALWIEELICIAINRVLHFFARSYED